MDDRRKNYRAWGALQNCQEPVSPRDALPEDDLVFFLLDLIPQMDLTLFHQYYAQEQGLDRFLETQHGGHEGIQRSRNPSPTHEVRSQQELLE